MSHPLWYVTVEYGGFVNFFKGGSDVQISETAFLDNRLAIV
jgi:hypothetical protein